MKKGVTVILGLLLLILQYRLWEGDGGILDVIRLSKAIIVEKNSINQLTLRNRALDADVQELKARPEALEERARAELGMIKQGETFCLVVEPAR